MRSLGRYAPALLLMGVIFFLSAHSTLPRTVTDVDVALRKLAHMTEFGLLWWLWTWGLRPDHGPVRAARVALAISLAYAVSDEVHQGFVATRNPCPFDVAIDAAGIGVAAAVWVAQLRRSPVAA